MTRLTGTFLDGPGQRAAEPRSRLLCHLQSASQVRAPSAPPNFDAGLRSGSVTPRSFLVARGLEPVSSSRSTGALFAPGSECPTGRSARGRLGTLAWVKCAWLRPRTGHAYA